MPTTLPRYTLTETPELRHAIDVARVSWPDIEDDRAAVLRRIIEVGSAAVERQAEERVERRRAAIRKYAGGATGTYPPDAAQLLKDEWPE